MLIVEVVHPIIRDIPDERLMLCKAWKKGFSKALKGVKRLSKASES